MEKTLAELRLLYNHSLLHFDYGRRKLTASRVHSMALENPSAPACSFYQECEGRCVENFLPSGIYTLQKLIMFGKEKGWNSYFFLRRMVALVVKNYQYLLDPKASGIIPKKKQRECVVVFGNLRNLSRIAQAIDKELIYGPTSSMRFFHNSHGGHSSLPFIIQSLRCSWTCSSQNYINPFASFQKNNNSRSYIFKAGPQNIALRLCIRLLCPRSRTDSSSIRHSPKILSSGKYVLPTRALQHPFKNWQESRRFKLTASTFGGAIGFFHGRRVQLWREKLGLIEPFVGNFATCWSNMKEEVALERYMEITGNIVSLSGFAQCDKINPKDEWLAASPDGLLDYGVYGLLSSGVLEIKCPYFSGEASRALPWKRIPLYYIPQAQGIMEVLDRNWMDFYVWTPNGSSLFRLERNQQYWEQLKLALSDFWWKHVQPAKELYHRDQFREVMLLKPAPRHELCNAIVYESRLLVDDAKLLVREIHGKIVN